VLTGARVDIDQAVLFAAAHGLSIGADAQRVGRAGPP
jgi:hypothetical protein